VANDGLKSFGPNALAGCTLELNIRPQVLKGQEINWKLNESAISKAALDLRVASATQRKSRWQKGYIFRGFERPAGGKQGFLRSLSIEQRCHTGSRVIGIPLHHAATPLKGLG
jgi:hypothetical protein